METCITELVWFGLLKLQPQCAPESLLVSFIIKPLNTTFVCFIVHIFAYIFAYIGYIFALHLVSSRLAIAVLCLNCKHRLRTLCVTKWKVVASFVSRCVMVSFSSVFAGERERRGGGLFWRRNKQLFAFFDFQMSNVK